VSAGGEEVAYALIDVSVNAAEWPLSAKAVADADILWCR
jgi:hypothetical protein